VLKKSKVSIKAKPIIKSKAKQVVVI